MIKEDTPKNESIEASKPIPQLAQESPKIEMKTEKVFKKLFLRFNFLLSLNKINNKRQSKDIEKIKSKTKINIGKIFNSLKSNKEMKNRFNFSEKVKSGTLVILIALLKFLKTK